MRLSRKKFRKIVSILIGDSFQKSINRVCEDDLDEKWSYLFKKAGLNESSIQQKTGEFGCGREWENFETICNIMGNGSFIEQICLVY